MIKKSNSICRSLVSLLSVGILVTNVFSLTSAQTLVPGMHGMSIIPDVKYTWVIISSDHEISLNLRYLGSGTTPPISIVATALTNDTQSGSNGIRTVGGSQVLNAGWISPNSLTIKIDDSSSLYDAHLVTVVVSPYTSGSPQATVPNATAPQTTAPATENPPTTSSPSTQVGCDPAYPDFCIPPPPNLNCDTQYTNFRVLPPDPHNFDQDGNGIGCEG